jgi:transposase
VLADSLRTDLPAFHLVKPGDPVVVSLRELTRLEEDLSAQNTRLSNRLREQLWRFYPQLLELSAGVDEPWVWELLELAPTPSQARFLTRGKIEKLLDRFRIRRLTADQVRDCLRQPAVSAAPGVVEAASYHLSVLLAQLRLLATQRKDCARRIDSLLDELEKPTGQQKGEHRDVTILRSLPGVGRVITATMLAEASQPLAERNYHALRAQSGIAPVTRQSGKSRHVAMRFGCNHRLRNALYHWARVSSQCDPSTKAHYHRLRQAGHTHPRALRGISSRLLKILIAMLRDRALYDASRFAQPETPKAA